MSELKELTEKEARELSGLIHQAYPQPDDDIRNAVMRRIRLEKAVKRKKQTAILRWGSLAAAVVLVVLVGVKTMPKLTSNKSMVADSARTMMDDTSTAIDDNSSEELFAESDMLCLDEAPMSSEKSSESTELEESLNCSLTANNSDLSISDSMVFTAADAAFAAAYIDVDGDGESEFVSLSYSEDGALIISASKNDEIVSSLELDSENISYSFENDSGKMVLREENLTSGDVTYYDVSAENGTIILNEK